MSKWIDMETEHIAKEVFNHIEEIELIKDYSYSYIFEKNINILIECILNYKNLLCLDLENLCEKGIIINNLEFAISLKKEDNSEYVVILNECRILRVYIKNNDRYDLMFDYVKKEKEFQEEHNIYVQNKYTNDTASIIDFNYLKNFIGYSISDLSELTLSIRNSCSQNLKSNFIILLKHNNFEKLYRINFGLEDIILYNHCGDISLYQIKAETLTEDIIKDMFFSMSLWENNKVKCSNCGKIIDYERNKTVRIFAGVYCSSCENTDKIQNMKLSSKL